MKKVERNFGVDFLRALSIILIVLAHTIPYGLVFELRVFDVVAIVLISSICTKEITSFNDYCFFIKRRVKRLLIPTYILITIILVGTYVACKVTKIEYIYSWKSVITSYLLIDGIGYVWIIRILLINALLTPLFQFICRKVKSNIIFTVIIVAFMCTSISFYLILNYVTGALYYLIFYYIIFTISYGAVFLIGQRIKMISDAKMLSLSFLLGIIVLTVFFIHKKNCITISLNAMKTPPLPYYLCYGLAVSLFIYAICNYLSNKLAFSSTIPRRAIEFLSTKSFSIYFVHIFIIKIFQFVNNDYENDKSLLLFFIIFILSVVITLFYELIKSFTLKIKRNRGINNE